MKKIYLLIVVLSLFCFYAKAQFVDIPNTAFRALLINKYPGCFNGAQQMDTTCTAIVNEDSLEFHNLVTTLSGIQYFDNLKYLDCSGNTLNVADLINFFYTLPASLLYLNCANSTGGLGSFPIPEGLIHFDFSNNSSLSVTLSPNLRYLDCSGNSLFNLNQLPAQLDTLICKNQTNLSIGHHTVLNILPALPATLRYLDCSGNGLGVLPSLPAGLTWLDCSYQYFHSLSTFYNVPTLESLPTLPSFLTYLNCAANRLTVLPQLPASLVYLNCTKNKFVVDIYDYPGIATLPELPANLLDLAVAENNLSALPSLPTSLLFLNVYNNPITCLPQLPLSMSGQSPFNTLPANLYTATTNINCLPNEVPGIRASPIRPVCTLSNNSNGCVPTPIISGNIFYDNNSNGLLDAGEFPRANVRVNLSNGQSAFSDNNGHYSIRTPGLGSFTVTVDAPPYYTAVPASFNYSFTTYDTSVTELVALQPNILVDSVNVSITPVGTARPGQALSYYVAYENVGTTVVNANILVNYDNSRISFIGSSNASVVNNGNSLNLSISNLSPGIHQQFVAGFTVNVSALINDSIFAKATVAAGTAVCVDSTYSVIRASFDPNYKQATVALTTTQVDNGAYINYMIAFQNTGTDTAFNIILTDTLTGLLQQNTVDIIQASHTCAISQDGNKLGFQFLNIRLPDSSTNEVASHGYVRFRIKAQPALAAGTLVPNAGFIYFDYNAPVPTGMANTSIYAEGVVVPVKLSTFTARKNQTSVQLHWSTEQEVNSQFFIVERSFNGIKWEQIVTVNAAGNSSQKITYGTTDFNPAKGINYYRLKQIDLEGRYAYSETRSVYYGSEIQLVLAPNPATEQVMIYLPENNDYNIIKLVDVHGRIVRTLSTNKESVAIYLTGIPKGLYIVKVQGQHINETSKLMIK